MKRAGMIAALAALVATIGVVALLPWGGPPEAAFRGVQRVQFQKDGPMRLLSPDEGEMLVDRILACPPVGMLERMQRCTPESGHTVNWDANGYPVTATVSEGTVWLKYKYGIGICGGRYVLRCDVVLPELPKIELPPPRSDVVSLRAHAEMVSILVGRAADPAWLDDLDSLKGETTFLVSATGDAVGWRVEGSGREFILAMRAIAAKRMPDLVDRASRWSDDGASAVEVVLGTPGWTRIETTGTVELARARLSGWIPPDPLDRVLAQFPKGSPLWVGLWASGARTGAVVARRHQPGTADVIVDGEISENPKRKDRKIESTRGLGDGDAMRCLDLLTAAGVTGHGARLGKVFAELNAHSCKGIRELGYGGDRSWMVEL